MCQPRIPHPTLNNTPVLVLKGQCPPTPRPGKWPVCLGAEMKSPPAFVGLWRVLDNRPFRSAPAPRVLGHPHPGAANPGALPGLNKRRGESGPAPRLAPEDFGLSDLPSHFLQARLLPQLSHRDALGAEGAWRQDRNIPHIQAAAPQDRTQFSDLALPLPA